MAWTKRLALPVTVIIMMLITTSLEQADIRMMPTRVTTVMVVTFTLSRVKVEEGAVEVVVPRRLSVVEEVAVEWRM